MGFFSWIAQDTGISIANVHSTQYDEQRPVYMLDDEGTVWKEKYYDGYGKFGGKDFYQLFAEMNHAQGLTGDEDHDRLIGISLWNGLSGIMETKTNKLFIGQNVDFFNWHSDKLVNGKGANQLIDSKEFFSIEIHFKNLIYPNLVHNIDDWEYDEKAKPKDCPFQGYFY